MLTAVYALSPTVPLAIVLVFFFGPTFSLRDVAQDSLLQATVDNEIIGRVYALRSTFSSLTFMISGIILAWLADQISVRWIYLLAGFLYAPNSPLRLTQHVYAAEQHGTTNSTEVLVTSGTPYSLYALDG